MTKPLHHQDPAFALLRDFLTKRCGSELKADQVYLVDGRLRPLLGRFGYGSLREMVTDASSQDGTPLCDAVLDAMTTHETQFFRDERLWRALAEQALPRLINGLKGRRGLRVWSAACSTGQEPYSMAMLLEERFPLMARSAAIDASDVSPVAVEYARAGHFADHEVARGIDAIRRARHFLPSSGGARLKPELRQRVRFFEHNLLAPTPVVEVDILFCRNVLIYMPDHSRKQVIARLARALSDEGILILGTTESVPELPAVATSGCYPKAALLSKATLRSGTFASAGAYTRLISPARTRT